MECRWHVCIRIVGPRGSLFLVCLAWPSEQKLDRPEPSATAAAVALFNPLTLISATIKLLPVRKRYAESSSPFVCPANPHSNFRCTTRPRGRVAAFIRDLCTAYCPGAVAFIIRFHPVIRPSPLVTIATSRASPVVSPSSYTTLPPDRYLCERDRIGLATRQLATPVL